MSATVLENLLHAMRRGIPDLSGGLCIGQWDLWGAADDPAAVEHAIQLCAMCPVLARCREYVDSLPPSKRPPGVTAGVWHEHSPRRKKVSA